MGIWLFEHSDHETQMEEFKEWPMSVPEGFHKLLDGGNLDAVDK